MNDARTSKQAGAEGSIGFREWVAEPEQASCCKAIDLLPLRIPIDILNGYRNLLYRGGSRTHIIAQQWQPAERCSPVEESQRSYSHLRRGSHLTQRTQQTP